MIVKISHFIHCCTIKILLPVLIKVKPDLMNTPGIQSLFRQMSSNPAMMQSLMSPENLNQVNNLFAQNPGIIQQVRFRLNFY